MSWLSRLFSRKPQEAQPMRDVAALARGLGAPALQVVRTAEASRSHFGGDPRLPAGVAWPQGPARRLDFIARLSLAEIQAAQAIEWLPREGALLFFYDREGEPWGYEPEHGAGSAVLLVADLEQPVAQPPPVLPEDDFTVPHVNLAFRLVEVLPSQERSRLRLSDDESEAYAGLLEERFDQQPRHQVGGLPYVVQNDDMEFEAQLASNGLRDEHPPSLRAVALMPGAREWRLLLQVDTDDELGVMWGDCGLLYWWVHKAEARAGRFGKAWVILQCS